MRLHFIALGIALSFSSTAADAQTVTSRGISTSTSNARLENEFSTYRTAQRGRDDAQDNERAAIADEVATLRAALETLNTEVSALREQAAAGSGIFATYEQSSASTIGTDTDSFPVTRSGLHHVSATCPAGYRFTGDYDAPHVAECPRDIQRSANGASWTCGSRAQLMLTVYCAR